MKKTAGDLKISATLFLDKAAVDVPKTLENEANEFPAGDRDTRDRCDLETSKDSSGSSEPRAPTLDKETGLFSIKPKGIKNISVWNTNLSRPKLDRLHAKSSRNNIPNKSRLGKSIEKEQGSLVSPKKAKVRKDSTPDRSYEEAIVAEASTALEVCNLAGIHFAASNELVCSRLAQLITDNSDLD
ncbi:hypothetical protein V6N12_045340 [Hibiscus sabdariffa]|uniref:Uncharacterized protein n=1 Tax=Hibiscus sabdariffa TaxID=183260 RepID=A0ABR2G2H3_9ROSI